MRDSPPHTQYLPALTPIYTPTHPAHLQWFRYSDDGGASWSTDRYKIPIRVTSLDDGNPWNGTQLQGWTVSKPIVSASGSVILPYTKVGTYLQGHDRNWVMVSHNLLTEQDPNNIVWNTYPEGNGGAFLGCGPEAGDIAEEGGVLSLGNDTLLYLFRTENGRMNQCRSRDGGQTWESGLRVRYQFNARADSAWLKQPRGPLTARRLIDGSFLLLFFNNGWEGSAQPQNYTIASPFFTKWRKI